MIDPLAIREKFGSDYIADERTYTMGMDHRFTSIVARRFRSLRVLETCTGAGFTTIALAREAEHVITVEIDPAHQSQAKSNIETSGLSDRVTFVLGDALDRGILDGRPPIDAAFLDPDWAVTGPEHIFHFKPSNTRPPSDELLERALEITPNIALILPPLVVTEELEGLPVHERQKVCIDGSHELYCLYFGELMRSAGDTGIRISKDEREGSKNQ